MQDAAGWRNGWGGDGGFLDYNNIISKSNQSGGAVKRNTVASLQFGSRRDESGARNEAMASRRGPRLGTASPQSGGITMARRTTPTHSAVPRCQVWRVEGGGGHKGNNHSLSLFLFPSFFLPVEGNKARLHIIYKLVSHSPRRSGPVWGSNSSIILPLVIILLFWRWLQAMLYFWREVRIYFS